MEKPTMVVICSHVLLLKEVSLKIIIIFYSILMVTDDLYHLEGQILALKSFLNYLLL